MRKKVWFQVLSMKQVLLFTFDLVQSIKLAFDEKTLKCQLL